MDKLRNELTVVEALLIESQRWAYAGSWPDRCLIIVRDNEQKQASLERYKRYVKVSKFRHSSSSLMRRLLNC